MTPDNTWVRPGGESIRADRTVVSTTVEVSEEESTPTVSYTPEHLTIIEAHAYTGDVAEQIRTANSWARKCFVAAGLYNVGASLLAIPVGKKAAQVYKWARLQTITRGDVTVGAPHVLDPSRLKRIEEVESAVKSPEMTLLALAVHGIDARAQPAQQARQFAAAYAAVDQLRHAFAEEFLGILYNEQLTREAKRVVSMKLNSVTPFHARAIADAVVKFLTASPGKGFGLTLSEQQTVRIRRMPYDALDSALEDIFEKKEMLKSQKDPELVLTEIGLGRNVREKTQARRIANPELVQHNDDRGLARDDGGLEL